jgi:catechol 2,3-dioxygenase-like lactoylglutathione lyase family enzyme
MVIERIGHIVLTVKDIDETCRFYTNVLGMQIVTFGGGRKALQFGEQKINLHEAGKIRARYPTMFIGEQGTRLGALNSHYGN